MNSYISNYCMNNLLCLPIDIFKHEFMEYLTIYDIVNLDNSLLNHELRYIYLNIIKGFVIVSIKYENNANYLEWIIKKEMYIRNILMYNTNMLQSSSLFRNYNNSLKYVQNLHIDNSVHHRKFNRCEMLCGVYHHRSIFNKNCFGVCIDSKKYFVNDNNRTALMSLQIYNCKWIDDSMVQELTLNCTNLSHVTIYNCHLLTNNSMLNLITNKNNLQQFNIHYSRRTTDSIICDVLKNACFTIKSLTIQACPLISDDTILFLKQYCNELKCLTIISSALITVTSIVTLLTNNETITSLGIINCKNIKHEEIITISNHCNSVTSLYLVWLSTHIQR